MMAFIRSIDALEEVSVTSHRSELGDVVWPTIFYAHGASLRKLSARWIDPYGTRGLKNDKLQVLIEEAPRLEEVSLELALVHDMDYMDSVRYIWVSWQLEFEQTELTYCLARRSHPDYYKIAVSPSLELVNSTGGNKNSVCAIFWTASTFDRELGSRCSDVHS
jgi:hypothetical protein